MNNKLIQQIAGKFSGKTRFETFKDYITDIHFPFYKGLVPGSKIDFKFPLTVLVGENGCGKSSVLQALEKVSEGESLSQRWFSTSVDPIKEKDSKGNMPSFWYSYYNSDISELVEVLNVRSNSKGPDYWEPSRPVLRHGMKKFSDPKQKSKYKTRWPGTTRKVEYIDFREEISAFDKYFYFGIEPHKKTKQEYIRQRSKNLKKAIDGNLKNDLLRSIVNLVPEEVSILSDILDKQYQSVKIIEHKFYSKWGTSVYFSQGVGDASFSGKYSEAFAGSGESAVAKLVHKIFSAQEGTLLLLDEPEVSLHPGAQKRLLNYILENVRDKGLQVVISTHSPAIVEELPPEAIVVMNQTALNKFDPIPDVFAETAFQYIGHTNIEKPKIIVEDKTAELLVNRALDICNPKAIKSVKVVCHPGGARDLYKEAVVLSRLDVTKTYLLLDGDQQKELPAGNAVSNSELDQAVLNITGIDVKDLDFVADSGKQSEQLPIEKRKFLDFLKSNCKFLPLNTPEEILWKCSEKSPHTEIDESKKDAYKKAIADWAKEDIKGEVSASDIFTYHKILCNAIPESDETMQEIISIIKQIVG